MLHHQCGPQRPASQDRVADGCHAGDVHPEERVRFVTETARAVIDGRLAADEAAAAVSLQAEQLVGHLRADRDAVTRSECESVATRLRLLAEQVADAAGNDPSPAHQAIAATIGELAQALR